MSHRIRSDITKSPGQHKIVCYVQAPVSCLPFAFHCELPIPWKTILTEIEYRLLKDGLCLGSRLSLQSGDDLFNIVQDHDPFLWSICCHDYNVKSLRFLARIVVLKSIMYEFLRGMYVNQDFLFYREFVNKRLCNRILYQGSVMFRGLHLIYIRVKHWSDLVRVTELDIRDAVYCLGYTSWYVVLICRRCADETKEYIHCCARRTRALLRSMADACDLLDIRPSGREVDRQRVLRYLLTKHPCICL